MYDFILYNYINQTLQRETDWTKNDQAFYVRFLANIADIQTLYDGLYAVHPEGKNSFDTLIQLVIKSYKSRPESLKQRDRNKEGQNYWFLSNQMAGMSLYVDRFCGNIQNLSSRLDYFERLGINFLHLMPVFESPPHESDGGYAVSNFRKVDLRFGRLEDLQSLQEELLQRNMYLMLDIVLNHTSRQHEWAKKARAGNKYYQDYFYFFDDRRLPDEYDRFMPEIFPESAPGNFTWIEECRNWVMTVFHEYQWDLNYTNPHVFIDMLDNVFFYANLGVDLLRIDAPAFIWKELGTTCQNLSQAHTLLRLIRLCVEIVSPGMALLGEAIVAPSEIMKYFGAGHFTAHECEFAYNATHMALQWDALATGDVRVMMAAQHEILKKPKGCSWITYTRCHDDIGLGYEDYMIEQAGWNAFEHRNFLKNYFAGNYPGSPSRGALFSYNTKTGDARISGTLASLCGLEKAVAEKDPEATTMSIRRILMMQAHSFFIGGLPMIFYGDELGYINDYSYLNENGKSYDNRWMHRPVMHPEKLKLLDETGTPEERIFSGTRRLLHIRKKLPMVADMGNLVWLNPQNIHVASFVRKDGDRTLYCLFNFSGKKSRISWYVFRQEGYHSVRLYDYWHEQSHEPGEDYEYFTLEPYSFYLMEGNGPKN